MTILCNLVFLFVLLLVSPAHAVMRPHAHHSKALRPAYAEQYDAVMQHMHRGMDIAYSGDPDTDFLRGMVPHHQGAVEMAKIELKYGTDPFLRRLAGYIIGLQQGEIEIMNQWLRRRGVLEPTITPAQVEQLEYVRKSDEAMHRMHEGMTVHYSGNADADFARSMIAHHQGAVDMAAIELHYGKYAELRQLARGIFTTQESEIASMQRWLDRHHEGH